MPKRTLLFAAIIFIIQTGPAFAQSAFLQRGESGFGIDAGLTTNKDAFGYYIQPSVEVAYLISAGTTQQGPYNSGSSENILVYSAGITYVVRSSTAAEYLVTQPLS